MPVSPYSLDCFKTHRDLYNFLFACKQAFVNTSQIQLISISFSIPEIDPLAVLQTCVSPQERHFYFEKSGQQQALLAVGSVMQLELEGSDRFAQSRDFIQRLSQQITLVGDVDGPFAGAHFFCGFSFFAQSTAAGTAGSVLLPQWQVARLGSQSTIVVNVLIDHGFDPQSQSTRIWQQIQAIQTATLDCDRWVDNTIQMIQGVSSPEIFQTAVQQALQEIRDRKIAKIVLARAFDVVAATSFNLVASLHNLRQLYQDCYIFSSHQAQGVSAGQTFIGASPERLVTMQQHRLETDALAGSAPRGHTEAEDIRLANQLLSSEKETHEHQLVIDFITQHLGNLGLQPKILTPRLLQLPNIQHLHTPIAAEVPESVHLLDILAELHPTPAVAGVPRELACRYIQQLEPFERSSYAAPIGWVDAQGNGEFAVGIRSAILQGRRARLFAGAGIVEGSNPDRELVEVQLKLQALLRALT